MLSILCRRATSRGAAVLAFLARLTACIVGLCTGFAVAQFQHASPRVADASLGQRSGNAALAHLPIAANICVSCSRNVFAVAAGFPALGRRSRTYDILSATVFPFVCIVCRCTDWSVATALMVVYVDFYWWDLPAATSILLFACCACPRSGIGGTLAGCIRLVGDCTDFTLGIVLARLTEMFRNTI